MMQEETNFLHSNLVKALYHLGTEPLHTSLYHKTCFSRALYLQGTWILANLFNSPPEVFWYLSNTSNECCLPKAREGIGGRIEITLEFLGYCQSTRMCCLSLPQGHAGTAKEAPDKILQWWLQQGFYLYCNPRRALGFGDRNRLWALAASALALHRMGPVQVTHGCEVLSHHLWWLQKGKCCSGTPFNVFKHK